MKGKINLNGDAASTLVGELMAVYLAAEALKEKLQAVTINGRNYPSDIDGLQADGDARLRMALMADEVRQWAQQGVMHYMEQDT